MQEFSSVIASSYDADSLAPMLTEKAREGWSVVSIVAAGTNVVAYLSRGAGTDTTESSTAEPADTPTQTTETATAAVSAGFVGDAIADTTTGSDAAEATADDSNDDAGAVMG
ncbi:hypothetical protein, partial [Ilumatobacter sp.]|uniref:hypothetical protein n=1 Tax=Ilumatobacter sp. TaxID=1967498 RepID=UPI003C60DA47